MCLLFYYLACTTKLKTVHLQGFLPKQCISSVWDPTKNRASSRLLVKNRVSQVFWEPIKNRVSPRSALLKAVYLEALLYSKLGFVTNVFTNARFLLLQGSIIFSFITYNRYCMVYLTTYIFSIEQLLNTTKSMI